MLGNYGQVGGAMVRILSNFNWIRLGVLYHNFLETKAKGHSECYHTIAAIINNVNNSMSDTINRHYDEDEATRESLVDHLKFLSTRSRSKFFVKF